MKEAPCKEVWSRELMLIFFQPLLDHAAASLVEGQNVNLLDDLEFFGSEVRGIWYLHVCNWLTIILVVLSHEFCR